MQLKVVSKAIVKPSSPTPPHLKTYKLSLLDQFSPVIYTPLVLFYRSLYKNHESSQKNAASALKKSLSESLTYFPLLAGRIIGNSIHCNDEGAIFQEASIDCSMSEFLVEPSSEMLSKLSPCSSLCTEPLEEYAQVVAQLNAFNCGGIAICICFLHKLIDATTLSSFLTCWASLNGGSFDSSSRNLVCSDYREFSSLFPESELLPVHPRISKLPPPNSEWKEGFQRFVFDSKAISDLKMKAKSIKVPNPTCVEAVSGFIWKYAMGSRKPSALMHAVDLRRRMEPPLPQCSVGNIFWVAISQHEADETEEVELNELVSRLRGAFAEIDSDYIEKLRGIGEVWKFMKETMKLVNEIPNVLVFSSWRNMNLNGVDFGWGNPDWVSVAWAPNVINKNVVVLLDGISGDGIEAWILLHDKEMQLLKRNPEFLEFALVNPRIILS